MTQEEAVNQVLKAGKRLLGESAFDQEDVQDTLDGVRERWSELTTKVGWFVCLLSLVFWSFVCLVCLFYQKITLQ